MNEHITSDSILGSVAFTVDFREVFAVFSVHFPIIFFLKNFPLPEQLRAFLTGNCKVILK